MLRTRILSAAVFAPALLGVVYVGGFWLHGVCAVLALLAFWELSRMFGIAERPSSIGRLPWHLRDCELRTWLYRQCSRHSCLSELAVFFGSIEVARTSRGCS